MKVLRYHAVMTKRVLSESNPYLRDRRRAEHGRARSIATSTAIETGEDAAEIERRILAGARNPRRAKLAFRLSEPAGPRARPHQTVQAPGESGLENGLASISLVSMTRPS
ncbi:hypothetical protein [uncultured Thiohalocapsa sp.]|uniref:hypothetical protein n=1 Tax=uncultured Thiohalocapsa sp. TaxID=768990 RepID=UPI0025F92B7A|nr:hypothetical protein [uncultured Thiohalocapsa sp.]